MFPSQSSPCLRRRDRGAAGRSQDDVVFIPLAAARSRILGNVRGAARWALDFIMIKAVGNARNSRAGE